MPVQGPIPNSINTELVEATRQKTIQASKAEAKQKLADRAVIYGEISFDVFYTAYLKPIIDILNELHQGLISELDDTILAPLTAQFLNYSPSEEEVEMATFISQEFIDKLNQLARKFSNTALPNEKIDPQLNVKIAEMRESLFKRQNGLFIVSTPEGFLFDAVKVFDYIIDKAFGPKVTREG